MRRRLSGIMLLRWSMMGMITIRNIIVRKIVRIIVRIMIMMIIAMVKIVVIMMIM